MSRGYRSVRLTLLMLLCLILIACTGSSNLVQRQQDLARSSVVTSTTGTINVNPDSSILVPPLMPVYSDTKLELNQEKISHITSALQNEFRQKGFTLSSDPDSTTYRIKPAVLYGNALNSMDFIDEYGVQPFLSGESGLERGTLIVLVIHAGSKQVVWRGAVQLFTDETLTLEQSHQRVDHAVRELLEHFPSVES